MKGSAFMEQKYVYLFSEGSGNMKETLGGKGANLAKMTKLGLPVPFSFTVSTQACNKYYSDGKILCDDIKNQIYQALSRLEEQSGKKFEESANFQAKCNTSAGVRKTSDFLG